MHHPFVAATLLTAALTVAAVPPGQTAPLTPLRTSPFADLCTATTYTASGIMACTHMVNRYRLTKQGHFSVESCQTAREARTWFLEALDDLGYRIFNAVSAVECALIGEARRP